MFSADLSWVEPGSEKVGERKERLARERSTVSVTRSVGSSKSSRASMSSVADDREMWWTSSLRKAKALKPKTKLPPGTSHSLATQHSRKASSSHPLPEYVEPDGMKLSQGLRDPSLQPGWTYSSTLSSTLPSGAPLDPPEYEIPELEGDISSRGTGSSESRSSHERRWSLKIPAKGRVSDDAHEAQRPGSRAVFDRAARRSSEVAESERGLFATLSSKDKRTRKPSTVRIEGYPDMEGLKLQDEPHERAVRVGSAAEEHQPHASGLMGPSLIAWRPPSDLAIRLCVESRQEKQLPPPPALDGIEIAHSNLLELTRFQRFIRRMENAGPKVILDRLKEEWHNATDEEGGEEVRLEKQLWVLTAFQLQNSGRLRTCPKPQCNTGKILELYGNLAEVYQLSAMHARQKVQYLTTEPQRPMPLPGNVSYLTVPQPGVLPYPWPESTFSHIRASTLPSLVPSSKLPHVLHECYRLLAPGGMLEIRVMDAAPVRSTAGPKMRAWIEDRLMLNLERQFRCSKPCMLLPTWIRDAGFQLPIPSENNYVMRLPCTFDKRSSNIDGELKTLVGHALWRDIWGDFVDDDPDESRWWWEDEGVMQECLVRHTVFECGAIFAYKK